MFSQHCDLFHIQMPYGRLVDPWNMCACVCVYYAVSWTSWQHLAGSKWPRPAVIRLYTTHNRPDNLSLW